MLVRPETVPIVSIKAFVRSQPHKTIIILIDCEDAFVEGLTTYREVDEANILPVDDRKLLNPLIGRGGGETDDANR